MTSNLRILLAEDNEVNQHLMMRILARIGYEVTLAKTGIQVLNKMDRQDFDVILMDIQMPEMDGITATKLIRAHYAPEKQPRIIALTADTSEEKKKEIFSAGMNDMLTKPVQIAELAGFLQNLTTGELAAHQEVLTPKRASSLNDFPTLEQTVIGEFLMLMGEEGKNSACHLIELYRNGTPELIKKIETASTRKDLEVLLKTIHTLKGSSSQIGALRMVELCARLEVLLKQSGIEPFLTFLPSIQQEFLAIDEALTDFLKRL